MRKLIVVALAAAAVAVLAATALAATRSVEVGDNYYVRPSGVPKVTVSKGTTVAWHFRGSSAPSVTVSRGPVKFNSGVRSSGTFRRKMRRRGTYTIFCL